MWRIQRDPLVYRPARTFDPGIDWIGSIRLTGGVPSYGNGHFVPDLAGWLILTFFFILAPTSSFVPIADIAVEHRMYLASAIVVAGSHACFVVSATAGVLMEKVARWPIRFETWRLSCIAFADLMGLLCLWRTHLRNRDYQRRFATLGDLPQKRAPAQPPSLVQRQPGIGRTGRLGWSPGTDDLGSRQVSHQHVPMYDLGLAQCLSRMQAEDR